MRSANIITDSEASMVQALYGGPLREAGGERMLPGWPRGSEGGWGSYLISPAKPVRLDRPMRSLTLCPSVRNSSL
jgi:hypothetical protein